jgi:cyclohexa-1,5-dienecarbonyl-CoA hydratase
VIFPEAIMSHKHIKVVETNDGQVTEIALGPPPANILSAEMMKEISGQLREDGDKPHKKLIVFAGQGKHFSFGASVEEHTAENVPAMLPTFHSFIGDLINCDVPTLAKVTGQCLGGSFELVLACDFIFAAKGAKLGVPEIQLGVFPPVACVLAPLKSGGQLASHMILTGERFTATELYRQGLVNQVADAEQLDEAVSTFFQDQIQPKSASSLRIAKSAGNMMLRDQYKSLIARIERLYLKDLMATADAVEGIQAFLEKRDPEWKDK